MGGNEVYHLLLKSGPSCGVIGPAGPSATVGHRPWAPEVNGPLELPPTEVDGNGVWGQGDYLGVGGPTQAEQIGETPPIR